jgi:hypothetical protein
MIDFDEPWRDTLKALLDELTLMPEDEIDRAITQALKDGKHVADWPFEIQ